MRLQIILLDLVSKCLGFIVGWAWYDVAHAVVSPRLLPTSAGVYYFTFALLLTTLCTAYTIFFGADVAATSGRESSERIFLANALGMVQARPPSPERERNRQRERRAASSLRRALLHLTPTPIRVPPQGWSWSDLVDFLLKRYLESLDRNQITTSGGVSEVGALLVVVILLSVVMLVAHVWVTQPSAAVVRFKWKRATCAVSLFRHAQNGHSHPFSERGRNGETVGERDEESSGLTRSIAGGAGMLPSVTSSVTPTNGNEPFDEGEMRSQAIQFRVRCRRGKAERGEAQARLSVARRNVIPPPTLCCPLRRLFGRL